MWDMVWSQTRNMMKHDIIAVYMVININKQSWKISHPSNLEVEDPSFHFEIPLKLLWTWIISSSMIFCATNQQIACNMRGTKNQVYLAQTLNSSLDLSQHPAGAKYVYPYTPGKVSPQRVKCIYEARFTRPVFLSMWSIPVCHGSESLFLFLCSFFPQFPNQTSIIINTLEI